MKAKNERVNWPRDAALFGFRRGCNASGAVAANKVSLTDSYSYPYLECVLNEGGPVERAWRGSVVVVESICGSNDAEFCYRKRVAFHETDSMGVVHHSNYIRYFEEARVAWLRDRGLIELHAPRGSFTFAVVDVQCKYIKPARFEDEIEVKLEVRIEGVKLVFRYAVVLPQSQQYLATGRTALVALNAELQLVRLPPELKALVEHEKWSATWPPVKVIASSS